MFIKNNSNNFIELNDNAQVKSRVTKISPNETIFIENLDNINQVVNSFLFKRGLLSFVEDSIIFKQNIIEEETQELEFKKAFKKTNEYLTEKIN